MALRDVYPDWYAHHGSIARRWHDLTDDEAAVLAAADVHVLRVAFMADDLLRAVEELAAEVA